MESAQLLLDGCLGYYGSVGTYGAVQRIFFVGLAALPLCLFIASHSPAYRRTQLTPLLTYRTPHLVVGPLGATGGPYPATSRGS